MTNIEQQAKWQSELVQQVRQTYRKYDKMRNILTYFHYLIWHEASFQ